jgi:hypothetical protein
MPPLWYLLSFPDPAPCTEAATSYSYSSSSSRPSAASTTMDTIKQQWYACNASHDVMLIFFDYSEVNVNHACCDAHLTIVCVCVCVCVGYSSKVSSLEMEIPADLIIRIGDSIFPLHKVRTVVDRW